jgi:hypothetical protein
MLALCYIFHCSFSHKASTPFGRLPFTGGIFHPIFYRMIPDEHDEGRQAAAYPHAWNEIWRNIAAMKGLETLNVKLDIGKNWRGNNWGNLIESKPPFLPTRLITIAALLRRYLPSPHPLLRLLSHIYDLASIN